MEPAHDQERDVRIGQVLDEYLNRRAHGESPTIGEFAARYPELGDELQEALTLVRGLRQPPPDAVEALIRQGVLTQTDGAQPDGPQPAGPPPRTCLGPYLVAGCLGSGGMGIVLDAYDPSLDRPVAIKVMRPEFAQEAVVVARFQREGKAAAALQHPNIAVVHSVGQERGVPYLVMERVHGPNLRDVLRSSGQRSAVSGQPTAFATSPLPADFIRTVFRQLLCGLAAAHGCGVIHRDIKPANILLDTSHQPSAVSGQPDSGATSPANASLPGRLDSSLPGCLVASLPSCLVKIIDFGLARVREARSQVTVCGSIFGTPEYMSPEQARGDANIDHRTDLYSAGVVLYEMLTGCTPFKADSATATIHRILHDEPADPRTFDKSVDPVLASLALRLMSKRPGDRCASATVALRALDSSQRVRIPRRNRRRNLRASAIVGMLVLAGAAGWLFLKGAGARRHIAKIELSADHRDILAYYGNSTVPERLPWLQGLGYQGKLTAAMATATLSDLSQVVAIGCGEPLPGVGQSTLITFNADGSERWRLDPKPKCSWPDAKYSRFWCPRHVVAGTLDPARGQELLLIANDPGEYPTSVSIIDPDKGLPRSTLWHFGQIQGVLIIADYFDDHASAVVAWGLGNKLDGFNDGIREPERQLAQWDIVSVLMVLRPDQMHGLAPPRVNRERFTKLGWEAVEPAGVWAYAFLDLPADEHQPHISGGNARKVNPNWRESMPDEFAAGVTEIVRSSPVLGARLEVRIAPKAVEEDRACGANLELDQNLALIAMRAQAAGASGHLGEFQEFWEHRWRVLVQNGKYVGE